MSNELQIMNIGYRNSKALKEGNMVRDKVGYYFGSLFIMKEKIIGASIGSII